MNAAHNQITYDASAVLLEFSSGDLHLSAEQVSECGRRSAESEKMTRSISAEINNVIAREYNVTGPSLKSWRCVQKLRFKSSIAMQPPSALISRRVVSAGLKSRTKAVSVI